jgi:hypothetical protein
VQIGVASNSGSQRVGHVGVAGQTYTVTQAAHGSSPAPQPGPAPGPGPQPGPAPAPPPPAPQPTEVDGTVSGLSGRCPNLAFQVDSTTVAAGHSTEYLKGRCEDVRNGRGVIVTGTVQPDGILLATRIELKKK